MKALSKVVVKRKAVFSDESHLVLSILNTNLSNWLPYLKRSEKISIERWEKKGRITARPTLCSERITLEHARPVEGVIPWTEIRAIRRPGERQVYMFLQTPFFRFRDLKQSDAELTIFDYTMPETIIHSIKGESLPFNRIIENFLPQDSLIGTIDHFVKPGNPVVLYAFNSKRDGRPVTIFRLRYLA